MLSSVIDLQQVLKVYKVQLVLMEHMNEPGPNIINGTNLYYNIGNNTDLAFQGVLEALDSGDIAIGGNYDVNDSTFPGSYLVTLMEI